ncbi:hypothetical protein [Mesorhizobium sp. M0772]|uniref:acyl carrier protein n=1 Tax=Mesorhizobium sp. M0772 TaxID=2956998 RepID=UPI00333860FC
MNSYRETPERAEKIEAISTFLSKHVRNAEFGISDDIFASGLLNSLFALQLVTFIESHFRVPIEDEDLVLENFSSILAMASFIESKQRGAG